MVILESVLILEKSLKNREKLWNILKMRVESLHVRDTIIFFIGSEVVLLTELYDVTLISAEK